MLVALFSYVDQLLNREAEGQGMVEYGLILVLVSIAAVAALTTVGSNVTGVFNTIAGSL